MSTRTIHNPILPGFHPDPSAIRVGDTYYIATSTFEWYPGVEIYASNNLADWHLASHPLSRKSQLDLRGEDPSCGVWAPNLSWCDGLFYLVYTDMKQFLFPAKDMHNYLVTAPSIQGPWSEPIRLNSTGFDPALFHDDDGRKYVINLSWDFRKQGHERFGSIQAQEYDPVQHHLVGEPRIILPHHGLREGSTIYKHDGAYFLMVAHGGTGLDHASLVSRSDSLWGPYEDDPQGFLLTSKYDAFHPLQKAGHSSIIDTPDGRFYLVYHCSRPLPNSGRCTLGRETAIQELIWPKGGFPRLKSGGILPALTVEIPCTDPQPCPSTRVSSPFQPNGFAPELFTLRAPLESWQYSLSQRPGFIRLFGAESLFSRFTQSLLARKVSDFCFDARITVEAEPRDFHQMAGLVCMYDQDNFSYVHLTWDERLGRCLKLVHCVNDAWNEQAAVAYEGKSATLQVSVREGRMQWYYAGPSGMNNPIGPVLDASVFSDDAIGWSGFTGMMVGFCCQDLTGARMAADFTDFIYEAKPRIAFSQNSMTPR